MKIQLPPDGGVWIQDPTGQHWLMTWDDGAKLPTMAKGDYDSLPYVEKETV